MPLQASPAQTRSRRSKKQAASCDPVSTIVEGEVLEHERTTVIFRNLPRTWTRANLTVLLEEQGFQGCFDFAHVPVNFQDMANLGYALVNLICNSEAKRALAHFEGLPVSPSHNCSVAWSLPNQRLCAHIERYQNSPIMHESVPQEYKPALFQNGMLVPFPRPTKKLRAPRVRHAKASKEIDF
jgi:hypothetical protein